MYSLCRNMTPPWRVQVIAKNCQVSSLSTSETKMFWWTHPSSLFMRKLLKEICPAKQINKQKNLTWQESAGSPERPLGMEKKKKKNYIFTYRYISTDKNSLLWNHGSIWTAFSTRMGEILSRWSAEELICYRAKLLALWLSLGRERSKWRNLWSSVQPTSSGKLNGRSNMNSSAGSGLCPGL